jgi:hypothetical protein
MRLFVIYDRLRRGFSLPDLNPLVTREDSLRVQREPALFESVDRSDAPDPSTFCSRVSLAEEFPQSIARSPPRMY